MAKPVPSSTRPFGNRACRQQRQQTAANGPHLTGVCIGPYGRQQPAIIRGQCMITRVPSSAVPHPLRWLRPNPHPESLHRDIIPAAGMSRMGQDVAIGITKDGPRTHLRSSAQVLVAGLRCDHRPAETWPPGAIKLSIYYSRLFHFVGWNLHRTRKSAPADCRRRGP